MNLYIMCMYSNIMHIPPVPISTQLGKNTLTGKTAVRSTDFSHIPGSIKKLQYSMFDIGQPEIFHYKLKGQFEKILNNNQSSSDKKYSKLPKLKTASPKQIYYFSRKFSFILSSLHAQIFGQYIMYNYNNNFVLKLICHLKSVFFSETRRKDNVNDGLRRES